MLTIPANLQPYLNRQAIETDFLLKIAGATTTFRLSGKSRTITESGTDYLYRGLVKSYGAIKQRIELYTAKLNIGNMTITLINIPYKIESGSEVRLSEQFIASEICYQEATVYLWTEGIGDISDCLQIYKGVIRPIEKIRASHFDIELVDSTQTAHKSLPSSLIDLSDYTYPPLESENLPIPLVYGDFDPTKDLASYKRGMMIQGIWIEPNKLVFSDHPLKAVDAVWIWDEDLYKLVKLDSSDYTTTLDDSGRTTITIDDVIAPTLEAYIYPDKADITHLDDPFYCIVDEEKPACYDADNSSHTEISVDSYSPNGNQDDNHRDNLFGRFPNVSPVGDHISVAIERNYAGNFNPTYLQNARLYFWVDASSAEVADIGMEAAGSGPSAYDSSDITTEFNAANLTLQDITYPNAIKVYINGLYRAIDGTRQKLIEFYDMRLKVTYSRSIETSMRVFVEGEGRTYGSWIDGGGRSNSYNSGDLIENPVGILESISRDELGLTTADIDEDSFDDIMENLSSNWNMRIFLNGQIDSKKLMEKICADIGLGFYISVDGKAKLFRLMDISKDDDFTRDHYKKKTLDFNMGDERFLINDVDLYYDRSNILNRYSLIKVGSNSASQSKYGITSRKIFKSDSIDLEAVAQRLLEFYIGSGCGKYDENTTNDSYVAGDKVASKYQPTADFELNWIKAYFKPGGTVDRTFKCAIYNDSSGSPGSKIADADNQVVSGYDTAPRWYQFVFDPGVNLTGGTDYWLCIYGLGGSWFYYYDGGAANQGAWNYDALPGPDDPFGSVTLVTRAYCIHTNQGFWKDLRPTLNLDMTLWQKIAWEIGDAIEPLIDLDNYIKFFNESWGDARFKVIDKRLSLRKGLSYKLMKTN